ncbi:MAG: lipocalin family protein [Prolixibacteraceae bacterium]|nr:lipocalin family protein [Prolixibacteraceae bacterium]
MKKIIPIIFSILILTVSCNSKNTEINNKPVTSFDIKKYLGTWYEIARFDHKFEKGLVGVKAKYSYRKDGKIKVENSGFKESLDGEESYATGKAKIPDQKFPSKLKVSFFLFFYGDYYILELDKNYKWAVVGSSSDKYLWILSRTPQMDNSLYEKILLKIKKRGYNTKKLIKILQKEN